MSGAASLEADLEVLERQSRLLRIEWEKFFGGVEKRPPTDLKARVEALIRKHAGTEIRNSTLRFRYQGLTARYSSFNELWMKKLRALEEGRPIAGRPHLRSPTPPPPAPPPAPELEPEAEPGPPPSAEPPDVWDLLEVPLPPPPQPPRPVSRPVAPDSGVRVRDAARDREAVRALYDQFLEERRKTGESTAVRYDAFEKLIASQAERLSGQKSGAAVDFRLETKDGKVSLKAKVVR